MAHDCIGETCACSQPPAEPVDKGDVPSVCMCHHDPSICPFHAQPPVECAHYVYWQAATETYICNRCGVTLVFVPAAQWAAVVAMPAEWRADVQCGALDPCVHEVADQLEQVTRGEG